MAKTRYLNVRVPESLHEQLSSRAREKGMSKSAAAIEAMARGLFTDKEAPSGIPFFELIARHSIYSFFVAQNEIKRQNPGPGQADKIFKQLDGFIEKKLNSLKGGENAGTE